MKPLTTVTSLLLFSLSTSASAAIISASSDGLIISNPTSVAPGALESTNNLFIFEEQQSYTLSNDLYLDMHYDLSVADTTTNYSSGAITSGTKINSYFVHYDPLGENSNVVDYDPDRYSYTNVFSNIIFDTKILGVIWSSSTCATPCPSTPMYLDASDYLGADGTYYPTGDYMRGQEGDFDYFFTSARNDKDGVVVLNSPETNIIAIDTATFPAGYDQVRIITAATVVPVPASVWLFGSGLFVLIKLTRRNN